IRFEKPLVDVNLKLMDSFTKDLKTSMQRDVASGGPSEFDGLVHRVARLGKEYHVPTPLYDKISAWGKEKGIR
ncbi:MAG: oxidoreductase, partial [Schwartzia sp.]|nr:oxidoreductase [Schwartzia sp. (in: firmicutes)]